MWYITVETGWMDLDICGNEWNKWKRQKTYGITYCVRKDHVDIMAFTGNPVIIFDTYRGETKKTKPQKYQASLLSCKALWSVRHMTCKKKKKKEKILRNNQRNSFSTILTFVQKN